MSSGKPLPAEAEIVVVGAGVAGAATARFLRERACAPLVLERFRSPGHESSGRSAGMIRQHCDDAPTLSLLEEGAAWHRSEGAEHFAPSGSFLIGLGDEDISAHVPWAQGRGLHVPGDGLCDTEALLRHLLGGLDLRWGLRVESIAPEGDHLRLDTSDGPLRAGLVVNAAGAWAGGLGSLPLVARRRHLFRTAGAPPGGLGPFVWDVVEGLYFRPWGEGLLLCACDEEPSAPGDNREQDRVGERLREKLARLQPALSGIEPVDRWAGQRTFAPDGRFVIGWDPRVDGLYHVAALGGHGITAAPAVGRRAAGAIAAGRRPSPGDDPFDPARLL